MMRMLCSKLGTSWTGFGYQGVHVAKFRARPAQQHSLEVYA